MVLKARQELSPLENSSADFTFVKSAKIEICTYENLSSLVLIFSLSSPSPLLLILNNWGSTDKEFSYLGPKAVLSPPAPYLMSPSHVGLLVLTMCKGWGKVCTRHRFITSVPSARRAASSSHDEERERSSLMIARRVHGTPQAPRIHRVCER